MSRIRHTTADEPHFLVRALAAEYRDGVALAPHAHAWGQLIYSITGVMTVWTEQGTWVAPPQWAVWAPAGVAHAIRFTGAASLRTLYWMAKAAIPPAIAPPVVNGQERRTGVALPFSGPGILERMEYGYGEVLL